MSQGIAITEDYFKQYRQKLGFRSQTNAKIFLAAKDIKPSVDFKYIEILNNRLYDLVDKLNDVIVPEIKVNDLASFKSKYIKGVFELLKENKILSKLNNQGRRPENVYFNWMRGYVVSVYFLKALSYIFEVDLSSIELIGKDDFNKIETFKRAATADLKITLRNKEKVIIEVQAGFTGVNDIKQHKIKEANKILKDSGLNTIVIHFDLYNGQVAFVRIDKLKELEIHWEKRDQFEGQMVFSIDKKYFIWKITESPMKYKEMNFD